jgi:hypothetical protein
MYRAWESRPARNDAVALDIERTWRSWVRLYFVPVVPYGTDNYLVCPVCSRGLQVSDCCLRPGGRSTPMA